MPENEIELVSKLTGVDERFIAVGNGGSELILILGRGFGKRYLHNLFYCLRHFWTLGTQRGDRVICMF